MVNDNYEPDNYEYAYDTVDECAEAGFHLSECDDDGFCVYCGFQEDCI